MKARRIGQVLETLEKEYRAHERLDLTFDGTTVRFRSNSPELNADLADYYQEFISTSNASPDIEVSAYQTPALHLELDYAVKPPDPGKTRIKEEYADLPDGRVVRKRLTGMVMLFGGGRNVVAGPCRDNDNQVINFINNRLIQLALDRGAQLAHAAGVRGNGRGLALAGFAGMGKSTLALQLMSHGLDFVSNDRLLVVQKDGRTIMQGVPKLPRINPGTALNNPDLKCVIPEEERAHFEPLSREEIWDLEHKYDVRIEDCFGPDHFVLRCDMHGLAILNWQRNQDPAVIRPVDLRERRDLLGAVMKSPGLFYVPEGAEPDHSEEAFLKRLADVTVFEINGGVDFHKAADLCIEKLGLKG